MSSVEIQMYLKKFNHEVVEKALNCGLDDECYYNYLREMYFAFSGGGVLQSNYATIIQNVRERLSDDHNLSTATIWVRDYAKTFRVQTDFLQRMADFIMAYGNDEVKDACFAQLEFAEQTLWFQRRVLDMILFHTPGCELLHQPTNSAIEFAEALAQYEFSLKKINLAKDYVS